MNKQEIIAEIARSTGITQKDARAVFDTALDVIMEETARSGAVQLPGFGTFRVKTRGARVGVNPRTGEKISVPEGRYVAFTPAKAFRDAVRG